MRRFIKLFTSKSKYPFLWPTSISDKNGKGWILGAKTFHAPVKFTFTYYGWLWNWAHNFNLQFGYPQHTPLISKFSSKNPLVTPFARWLQTSIQKKPSTLILEHNKTTANTFKSQIYMLYQSFNETTSDPTPWPSIIFTLVDYDHGDDNTGYRIGSTSMPSVALGVNQM